MLGKLKIEIGRLENREIEILNDRKRERFENLEILE